MNPLNWNLDLLSHAIVEIGSNCEHPNMDINEFNDDYLNELVDKLFKES